MGYGIVLYVEHVAVCPQSIDPKANILKLQNISFRGFFKPNLNNLK